MWLMSLAKILWHLWESGLNAPEMVWYSEHQLCSSTLYERAEQLSIAHTTFHGRHTVSFPAHQTPTQAILSYYKDCQM